MVEFHCNLKIAVNQGFVVPPSILPKLDAVFSELKESVLKFSQKNKQQVAQFWIMMTT